MKKIILITLFFITKTFAFDCNNAMTTMDINSCMNKEFERIEKELNQVYKRQMKSLSTDTETKTALRNAQRLWIKFREADCEAVIMPSKGGSIVTAEYLDCMISHAKQRIRELKEF